MKVTMAVDPSESAHPERSAVIVIDPQHDFCSEDGALARRFGYDMKDIQATVPTLNAFIQDARRHGVLVVWVREVYAESKMRESHKSHRCRDGDIWIIREGSKGVEWYEGMVPPLEDEPVITKWHYDAFEDTDLGLLLESRKISTVVMTGFTTNVCVETSARHAYIKGYHVILVTNCCSAPTRQEHESAVFNIGHYFGRLTTADDLTHEWSRFGTPAITAAM
ncbi:MAG: cysteine hydrolase family protein [Nitrososphaerales archaeon]